MWLPMLWGAARSYAKTEVPRFSGEEAGPRSDREEGQPPSLHVSVLYVCVLTSGLSALPTDNRSTAAMNVIEPQNILLHNSLPCPSGSEVHSMSSRMCPVDSPTGTHFAWSTSRCSPIKLLPPASATRCGQMTSPLHVLPHSPHSAPQGTSTSLQKSSNR